MHVHLLISFTVTWTDLLILAALVVGGLVVGSKALWPEQHGPAPIDRVFEYRHVRRFTADDIAGFAVDHGDQFFDWQQSAEEVW